MSLSLRLALFALAALVGINVLLAEIYVFLGRSIQPDWLAAATFNTFLALASCYFIVQKKIELKPFAMLAYLPSLLVLGGVLLLALLSQFDGQAEHLPIGWQQIAWVVWIPVVEELTFRVGLGFLWRRWLGVAWGSYFSIMTFALVHSLPTVDRISHLDIGIPIGPLLLAIVCEVLWLRFGNLAAIFSFHAVCNLSVVLFSLIDARWLTWLRMLYL